MLVTIVEAPASEPMPTLTFSSPKPVISAVPETISMATPVSKNDRSLAVRTLVERIPVAVSVNEPVSMARSPWLTTD